MNGILDNGQRPLHVRHRKMFAKLYSALKGNKTLFSLKYRYGSKDYQQNARAMRAGGHDKLTFVADERSALRRYWSCPDDHYVRYGLFRKQLEREELLDYIPPYVFYMRHLAGRNRGIDVSHFSNKLVQAELFGEHGIPTPLTLGVVERGKLRISSKFALDDELWNLIEPGEKVFFKPVDGAGGNGIVTATKDGKTVLAAGQRVGNLSEILDQRRTYIVQKAIEQHGYMASINSSSVNTLRAITQMRDGSPVLSVCVLRIGRSGSDVDNSAQGGISVRVDVETGELEGVGVTELGGSTLVRHPDTNFLFSDGMIPGWKSLKARVLEFAARLDGFPEVAWDVAITEEGPCILEINFVYGIDHLQCCCGGLRRVLQVFP